MFSDREEVTIPLLCSTTLRGLNQSFCSFNKPWIFGIEEINWDREVKDKCKDFHYNNPSKERKQKIKKIIQNVLMVCPSYLQDVSMNYVTYINHTIIYWLCLIISAIISILASSLKRRNKWFTSPKVREHRNINSESKKCN